MAQLYIFTVVSMITSFAFESQNKVDVKDAIIVSDSRIIYEAIRSLFYNFGFFVLVIILILVLIKVKSRRK
ncbi:hypothetical protein [Fusibacter tunisiensis]|uniref:Cellulose synthase/poly-beta-1,6-N-acetylglucosamine synthase-like glycosyltransferase n=1 Tax=Fusibacter tunisiensis TaxID=1008308 RepID=A0ABS2MTS1_9FIRM|nr:hypothetical protein [Fusibacter tunisiensis]MBM7562821.1 cellulose synthase/poly-beta-1,6-N-acetylglucosamine synthase-like glycosyltransferase [Fusibacter tunisiensis]